MMQERLLYDIIEPYLKQKGYIVLREFPVGKWSPKRVDLLGVKSNELICVEVKLRNFRRVLKQAFYRLLFSDYVCVAFPYLYAMHVNRTYRDTLEEHGLGLMAVDGDVRVLTPPKRSEILEDDYKSYVLNLVKVKVKSGGR